MRTSMLLLVTCLLAGCASMFDYREYSNGTSTGDCYISCTGGVECRVKSEPTGAKVYVNDKYVGTTPYQLSVPYRFKLTIPSHKRIWMSRYRNSYYGTVGDWITERDLEDWQLDTYKKSVVLQSPSRYEVTLSLANHKPQTQILQLSGSSRDMVLPIAKATTYLKDNLEASTVDGGTVYKDMMFFMEPTGGGNMQQQQQQQQTVIVGGSVASVGKITLKPEPEKAEVYVDGMFVGNAPTTLSLTEGVHVIELRDNGFESYKKEIRVLADSELSLSPTLKKK